MIGTLTCNGPVMSDHGVAYCPDTWDEPTDEQCDACRALQDDALEDAVDRYHDLTVEVLNRG